MATTSSFDALNDWALDREAYVDLLRKLISEVEFLQDSPPDFVPEETRVANHVMEVLKPYTVESGGPLVVELVEYEPKRANLLITYPGKTDKCVSFVGSHMDVVPANPETWDRNPFELVVEGDKLYGRGTTDCLGHVALLTMLFVKLAQEKPDLDVSVHGVFIASEEAEAKPGVGVDGLMAAGRLDKLKAGPVLWVDCADSQPCIGSAGAIMWHLNIKGHLFHSGLPHRGINALELGMEAVKRIQDNFYRDFPAHPEEERYKFATPSTMKPTQMSCAKGGLNQIPPSATISGDIRLTPFYSVDEVKATVTRYVQEINDDLASLPTRGPTSKYAIDGTDIRGHLEIEFGSAKLEGIACDLESAGLAAIVASVGEIKGEAKPYSITGSLPLVRDLKDAGFDVQLIGFGLSTVYHADNEYCLFSDMADAGKILMRFLTKLNSA